MQILTIKSHKKINDLIILHMYARTHTYTHTHTYAYVWWFNQLENYNI